MNSPTESTALPSAVEQDILRYLSIHCPELSTATLTLKPNFETMHIQILSGAQGDDIARLPLPLQLTHAAQAVTRWYAQQAQLAWLCSRQNYRLDSNRRIILCADGEVALTDKETMLLLRLVLAAPQALSRTELLESIWRYDDQVDTHTLESHIYRLRQKLEPLSIATMLTTSAEGYRWENSESLSMPSEPVT